MEKEGAMCCRTRGRILYDESSKRFASNEHQESDGEHPGLSGKLGGVEFQEVMGDLAVEVMCSVQFTRAYV